MRSKNMAGIALVAALVCVALGAITVNAYGQKEAVAAKATLDNLMTAFNGESNANARYLAFAKKADEEGYGQVASLFRAAARAEQVHFERHADVIKKMGGVAKATIETPVVRSTKENLEDALKGEIYENKVMYPDFLAKAEKEKQKDAIDAFEDAMAAEGVHAAWYKKALANLDAWKGPKKDFYVCPLCGNVVDVLPGSACPICMTDTKKFMAAS